MGYLSEAQDEYLESLRQYEETLYRYGLAGSVLYFLVFLGGVAVCALAFTKLRGVSRGLAAWLQASALFVTLYCLLTGIAAAIWAPLEHDSATSTDRGYNPRPNFARHRDAAVYTGIIGSWFHFISQGLVFITIVAACAANSATGGQHGRSKWMKTCLIVTYVVGTLINAIASAVFALNIKVRYTNTHRPHRSSADYANSRFALVYVSLVLYCLLAAAAVFATVLAGASVPKTTRVGGKSRPAQFVVFAGLLLMLSTLYRLAWTVRYTWFAPIDFGPPAYVEILDPILDALPLLCSAVLLFLSAKGSVQGAKPRVVSAA